MYLSKISLVNYRNFAQANLSLQKGVNTIIGESGSGKSNLFRALRLLLDDGLVGRKTAIGEADFHRGLKDWRGHWIVIHLEFSELSDDEVSQALFNHNTADDCSIAGKVSNHPSTGTYTMLFRPVREILDQFAELETGDIARLNLLRKKINIEDYETVLFSKMSIDLTDKETYRQVVGDFDAVQFPRTSQNNFKFSPGLGVRANRYFPLAREFSFAFVPALRDVQAEFKYDRRNPLRSLLDAKSQDVLDGDFESIADQINQLNGEIESRKAVQQVRSDIQGTFKQTVGETFSPTSLSIRSELPLETSKLFRSLKLYFGEHGETHEGGLDELSLGSANLIYLTLKLLEFKYDKEARDAIAHFLVIEEPEAHIHTHVQKTLFERVKYDRTQIIYSTHSTHISSVSDIRNVNVIGREGNSWGIYQPAQDLGDADINAAQRFLDAIRCNLLFARSVMLVEGDAEEILIPELIKTVYGVTLDEIGLSLINVRSTGFETLANLFHENRLRRRCSILTDSDKAFINVALEPIEGLSDAEKLIVEKRNKPKEKALASEEDGKRRRKRLGSYTQENSYVESFFANHTFEVDFSMASKANKSILDSLVDAVYTQRSKRLTVSADLNNDNIALYGSAALEMANYKRKGWFALLLASKLDSSAAVPGYILAAIRFATGKLPRETLARIIRYRVTFRLDLSDQLIEDYRNNREIEFTEVQKLNLQRYQSLDNVILDFIVKKADYQELFTAVDDLLAEIGVEDPQLEQLRVVEPNE